MNELKPTCCKKVGTWLTNTCRKAAKFERDGKHYCGIHDPVSVKEKQDKRNAEWRKQYDANNAATEKAFAAKTELERRAACFPELLEALRCARNELHACQAVIHLVGGFDPAYEVGAQKALKIMDAVIAKALGEPL